MTRTTHRAGPGELTGQGPRRKGGGFGDSGRDGGGVVKDLGAGSADLLPALGLRLRAGGVGWAARAQGRILCCQECGLRLRVTVPATRVTKCVAVAVVWAFLQDVKKARGPPGRGN